MNIVRTILNKVLSICSAVLMGFMSILVVYQVITRYVFNNPSTWSEDLLTYSFVWMSLLAAALVFGERDHMRLALFSDKLKGISKCVVEILTELVIIGIVYVILVNGGLSFMNIGKIQVSPTLHISLNYIYCIMPLSGILILVYNVLNIIESVKNLITERKEVES